MLALVSAARVTFLKGREGSLKRRGDGQVAERCCLWGLTGEEKEPWVQAALGPAARPRPSVVCHGRGQQPRAAAPGTRKGRRLLDL